MEKSGSAMIRILRLNLGGGFWPAHADHRARHSDVGEKQANGAVARRTLFEEADRLVGVTRLYDVETGILEIHADDLAHHFLILDHQNTRLLDLNHQPDASCCNTNCG